MPFPRAAMTLVHSRLTATKLSVVETGRPRQRTAFAASMINCFETERPSFTRHCTKYR